MEEHAKLMINGACCARCGVPLNKDHGCPTVCNRCFREWQAKKKVDEREFFKLYGMKVETND